MNKQIASVIASFVMMLVTPQAVLTAANPNILLGEPKAAGSSSTEEIPLEKDQFNVGYSKKRFEPNWVSWIVTKESMGEVPRTNRFHTEQDLPEGMSATPSDYKKSGYDRGHVCPSADRTASEDDNYATFSMANMVPQEKSLNRGPWKDLEEYCRDLVLAKNKLYIVAGAYGGTKKLNSKVVVPSHCWKVIVVLPKSVNTPSEVKADCRVLAVLMPNTSDIKKRDWTEFITSVDEIEKKCHLDLLSKVPAGVEAELEAKIDDEGDDDAY